MAMNAETASAFKSMMSEIVSETKEDLKTFIHTAINESIDKKFETHLKKSIDDAIKPLTEKQDKIQAENENRFIQIEKHLVKLTQPGIGPIQASSNSFFPPLPPQQRFRPPGTLPSIAGSIPGPPRLNLHQSSTRTMIALARRVVGLSPINIPAILPPNSQTDPNILRTAALDFIRNKLNINDDEIKDADIVRVFTPLRSNNHDKVYVEFTTKQHADLCFILVRAVTSKEIKVKNYYPHQIYDRAMAIENAAYNLRNGSPKYKTVIEYNDDDLILLVCQHGHHGFRPHDVPNLPPILHISSRVLPSGIKRPRAPTSSPDNKKKEKNDSQIEQPDTLPNHHMDGSSHESASPLAQQLPIQTDQHTSGTQQDTGSFVSAEVHTPLTGRVQFQFSPAAHLSRRVSLNL